jgi:hypothetical protein
LANWPTTDYRPEYLPRYEFLGDQVSGKPRYYPTVTHEEFVNMGRIAELMQGGNLFEGLGVPVLDAANDWVMLCDSPAMMRDHAIVEVIPNAGMAEFLRPLRRSPSDTRRASP